MLTFPEPCPLVATLDGQPGPIQIVALDPATGECLARRIEIDPTTGGVDAVEWDSKLDQADLERLAVMAAIPAAGPPEPPDAIDEHMALGGAVEMKRQLIAQ